MTSLRKLMSEEIAVKLFIVALVPESPQQPLSHAGLESVRSNYGRTYAAGYGSATAFILVSLTRYTEIKAKFSTQWRFFPIALGPVHGLMWDGALVVPSDLVNDMEIGFMPVPSQLNVIVH